MEGKSREEKKSWEWGELNWMDLDEEIKSREEGEIGSEGREKGDLLPCSSPLMAVKLVYLISMETK